MSKTLNVNATTEVAKKVGTEPIIIVDIYWSAAHVTAYADRAIGTAVGKILEVSGLDGIIKLSGGGSTGTVSIKLDDTSGEIKDIINVVDPHKKKCYVYQAFQSLVVTDRFLLFSGEICTPIVWDEGDRSFSFDIVSIIEGREVGFSPEQGQYDYVSDAAVGVPWPLVFGNCIKVPATKITEAATGQMITTMTIPNKGSSQPLSTTAKAYGELKYAREQDVSDDDLAEAAYGALMKYENMRMQLIADNPDKKDQVNTLGAACISVGYYEANAVAIDNDLTNIRSLIESLDSLMDGQQEQLIALQAEATPNVTRIALIIASYNANNITRNALISEGDGLETDLAAALVLVSRYRAYEIVYEKALVSIVQGELHIDNGDTFTQALDTDIYIRGARIKGRFNGRIFAVDDLSTSYRDIHFRTRDDSANSSECWLDSTVILKHHYCLVKGSYGTGTDYRIIYITDHSTATYLATFAPVLLSKVNSEYVPTYLDTSFRIVEASMVRKLIWDDQVYPTKTTTVTSIDDLTYNLEPEFVTYDKTPKITWTLNVGDPACAAAREIYVANIIAKSTIKGVYGRRTIYGVERIVPIPSSYYIIDDDFEPGGRTEAFEVTALLFHRPLSAYHNENWKDEVYVTLESPEGPNTADVIQYLVEEYSDLSVDATTFASVHSALGNYPSHFPILNRPNVLDVIEKIAWQARCAVWISNNIVYIKYLAAEEAAIATITQSNIQLRSLKITFTETEELVTKFIANWKRDNSIEKANQVILRNNIPKYGLLKQEFNFFIYNIESLVLKSATFWMLRYSNTWKHVSFTAFLDQLAVETLDTVSLDLPTNLIASTAVKGTVKQVVYDSNSQTLNFDVWISVRAGEMITYVFAWPATASVALTYPTINDPYAGGES